MTTTAREQAAETCLYEAVTAQNYARAAIDAMQRGLTRDAIRCIDIARGISHNAIREHEALCDLIDATGDTFTEDELTALGEAEKAVQAVLTAARTIAATNAAKLTA